MRRALDELQIDYYDAIGEAAFYGPKIDFQVKNVNGKEDTLSTIQVDYSIAPKFNITYKDKDGQDKTPVIIHMALMGSIDRFMAFMLEMTAGRLPFWLAPEQVRILTINDQVLDYVEKIKLILSEIVLMEPLKYNELRFGVDDRPETLNKKIRDAEIQKIPIIVIVGPKDKDNNEVSIRTHEQGEIKVKLTELKNFISNFS
jgi:threonyl-tRNA synthetase